MIRNLSKHSLINILNRSNYLVGSFLFAYLLDTNNYGSYIVIISIISFASILLGLNLNQAYSRYIYEKNSNYKIFAGQLVFLLVILSIFFYVINLFFHPLEKFQLVQNNQIIPLVFVLSFGQSIEALLIQHSIRFNELDKCIKFYIFRSVLLSILSIFLVFFFKNIYLLFFVDSLFCIAGIFIICRFLEIHLSIQNIKSNLKYIFSYSLPLLPYTFSLIVLSQSDRLVITKISGVDDSATYSFVYNFGILLSFVFASLLNYFNNDFYENMNSNRLDKIIKQNDFIFKIMISLFLLLVFVISIFQNIIFPKHYLVVYKFLPLVVFTILIHGIWQIWARIIGYHKKTYIIGLLSSICAILSVTFNLFIIPKYGFEFAYYVNFVIYFLLSLFAIISILIIEKNLNYKDFRVLLYLLPLLFIVILTHYYVNLSVVIFGFASFVFIKFHKNDFKLIFGKF
jgi:O-antigen/teichoic acid export membrane protein